MRIIEANGMSALCEDRGEQRRIDLSLVGEQKAGTWVLTFLDTAREILSEEMAGQISDALLALDLVMKGEGAHIDALFEDLTSREPELPPHLRQKGAQEQ